LELAGGFAGEVEGAVEVAGAELAEGELEQDAGLAEAGRRLEEHRGRAFERGGEFGGGGFLAGARRGEGGAVAEMAEPFAGAEAEMEKLGDALELDLDERVVGRRERERLREARAGFDEDEFGAAPRAAVRRGFGFWVLSFGFAGGWQRRT
jgi:hypothetical protein